MVSLITISLFTSPLAYRLSPFNLSENIFYF